jgi:hypothetical protein
MQLDMKQRHRAAPRNEIRRATARRLTITPDTADARTF